jgi:hypothetical protein
MPGRQIEEAEDAIRIPRLLSQLTCREIAQRYGRAHDGSAVTIVDDAFNSARTDRLGLWESLLGRDRL